MATTFWPTQVSGEAPASAPVLPEAARYEDQGLLACGGMGEVRQIWDRRLERRLALKRMLPALAGLPWARERFHTESRVTAGLDHVGIVDIFDAGETEDGRLWYTMRLVASQQTLKLAFRAMDLRERLGVLAVVADAVAFAHARGVIHRDLKPDNVLVGAGGEVLLIDWGIARRRESGTAHWIEPPSEIARSPLASGPARAGTRAGGALGSPPYLAPEQGLGDVDAHGPWSDTWALGALLWEALTLTPISGYQALAPGAPPLTWPAGIPEPLRVLADACLAWSPAARPRDARLIADSLQRWLRGEEARSRALRLVEAADALAPVRLARAQEAERLAQGAAERLSGLGRGGDPLARQAAWDMEDGAAAARLEATLLEAQTEQSLRAALEISPGLEEARDRLAELYAARLCEAEAARDRAGVARAELQLRAVDRGARVRWLERPARLVLRTDAPDVRATLSRFELRGRRLVPEACGIELQANGEEHEIPRGSYLVLLEAAGRVAVRYPVFVGRGERWCAHAVDLPILLPPLEALGPEDRYVPAGPAFLGEPSAANGQPRCLVWMDGFILRRDPVTNREYIAFLDALVAAGRVDEARAFLPRASQGPKDPDGASPFRLRAVGGHEIVPDSEGDIWPLDWPVVLIDWRAARAFAAWEAERSGQPWRLPWELEREKATRGVDGRLFPWGDQAEPSWFRCAASQAGPPRPTSVGTPEADLSVYDIRGLAGNVRDWCLDLRDEPPRVEQDGRWLRPSGPPPADPDRWRVCRGGAWSGGPDYGVAGVRIGAPERFRHSAFGLRLARSWP